MREEGGGEVAGQVALTHSVVLGGEGGEEAPRCLRGELVGAQLPVGVGEGVLAHVGDEVVGDVEVVRHRVRRQVAEVAPHEGAGGGVGGGVEEGEGDLPAVAVARWRCQGLGDRLVRGDRPEEKVVAVAQQQRGEGEAERDDLLQGGGGEGEVGRRSPGVGGGGP